MSRCDGRLILMTSHLVRNEPLEHERIVICLVTRNKVSCQYGVTIDNRGPMTNTKLKIIHTLCALGKIAAVDLLIRRLGNGKVTHW